MRSRGAGREAVGPLYVLPFDLQPQGDELAGTVGEPQRRLAHETERLAVVGLLDDIHHLQGGFPARPQGQVIPRLDQMGEQGTRRRRPRDGGVEEVGYDLDVFQTGAVLDGLGRIRQAE